MSVLLKLKLIPEWSQQWELPLLLDNHWIYMGYADLVLRLNGEKLDRESVARYYNACLVPGSPGLINRKPVGSGQTSHDEVIGAASLDKLMAHEILIYFALNDGNYDNKPAVPDPYEGRWNIKRIPFLNPYLVAATGGRPNPVSRLIWAGHVLLACWNAKSGQVGAHLRIWLMADKMRTYPECKLALTWWQRTMHKIGLTLSGALAIEPGCAVLAEAAGEEWRWPE
jgi:hypothetical protein